MIDEDIQRRDAEHQLYLTRIRAAICERLTARGKTTIEIEWYLADLPADPFYVIARRMMAARQDIATSR
ncbi:hypothetical protein ACWGNZ_02855 [Sphingomonas zeae]|jgi:hypothetical protein